MKVSLNKSLKIERKWYIVDATDKILGRLASVIAIYLIGKHKLTYIPYIDQGDYIIVIHAKKVIVSGKKYNDKIYYHYTGYVGGLKQSSFKHLINRFPERIIKQAVRGMLPKNRLGRMMYKRLRVYSGDMHVHMAQIPECLTIL